MSVTRRQVLASLPLSLGLGGCLDGSGGDTGDALFLAADLVVHNDTSARRTATVRIWTTPDRPAPPTDTADSTVEPPADAPDFEETVDLAPDGNVEYDDPAALDERAVVSVTVDGGPSGTYATSHGMGDPHQLSAGIGVDRVRFGVVVV
ncbi:hypothetical protein [Halomarina oriensis]|uniref:Uncharacterized protein n=1 Tax=Halomarina oriensis TaxID=671145 RepID=A0A6B0GP76_9EURY|nr:hypothetical protein [Halomarina oriensis]MWG34473.1 hypothetical protein [Halomarina oriensis]